MIEESHFRVISYFITEQESEVSITTLASQLELSHGHTSRIVTEMETYGIATTTRSGRKKLVALADIEPIEQLEGLLTEYSHMEFPSLIGGSGLELLYYLDTARTATELSEQCTVSRATIYRRLDELQTVGIVGKSNSSYRLNDPFTVLSSIARGLFHQCHRQVIERQTTGLNFLWETHDEYLFACDSAIDGDGFYSTGPARFEEFDVPLLTRDRYHYFKTERQAELNPADLVCHMLLIDDSSRYRTYCLLVILTQGIDKEILLDRAAHYQPAASIDLIGIVEDLFDYLETEGETSAEQLPAWDTFKQTASEYEIIV